MMPFGFKHKLDVEKERLNSSSPMNAFQAQHKRQMQEVEIISKLAAELRSGVVLSKSMHKPVTLSGDDAE